MKPSPDSFLRKQFALLIPETHIVQLSGNSVSTDTVFVSLKITFGSRPRLRVNFEYDFRLILVTLDLLLAVTVGERPPLLNLADRFCF